MMWNGSWGWAWLGLLFMIFCMVVMMWMMSHGHGSHSSNIDGPRADRPRQAEQILAERLAHGEIDVDEYERRLAALHQASEARRT